MYALKVLSDTFDEHVRQHHWLIDSQIQGVGSLSADWDRDHEGTDHGTTSAEGDAIDLHQEHNVLSGGRGEDGRWVGGGGEGEGMRMGDDGGEDGGDRGVL